MEKWEIGDVGICIKVGDLDASVPGHPPLLRLYSEYVVNDIHVCSCGAISLDMGLVSAHKTYTICLCGSQIPDVTIHWCNPIRFVKKKSKEMLQLELNAAIEAEDYKLAQVLSNQLTAV
jgi:hypothetical protein